MTWILLVVLCAAFALYIAAPLFAQNAREYSPQFSAVEVRRESLRTQQNELQLDHETGKIDDAEFRRLELELELEDSVAATRTQSSDNSGAAPTAESAADSALEAEVLIARARNRTPQDSGSAPPTDVDAALENEIAKARVQNRDTSQMPRVLAAPNETVSANAATPQSANSNALWNCPSCARAMSGADQFCASCGTPRAA